MTQDHHLSCCVTLNYCVTTCIRLLGEGMAISGTTHGACRLESFIMFGCVSGGRALLLGTWEFAKVLCYFWVAEPILSSLQPVSCDLTHYLSWKLWSFEPGAFNDPASAEIHV